MKREEYFFLGIGLASAALYLVLASSRGVSGFSLDDAWIHQVYARNLGNYGEFAFFRGQPSAGSTSPLWTAVLAAGYAVRIDPRAWAYLLGALLTGAGAIVAARLAARLGGPSPIPVIVALFIVLEWHLAWSAVSGMEIPLFIFLSLVLLERFYSGAGGLSLGLAAGLLTLTRPEGIVLAALVGAGIVWNSTLHLGQRSPKVQDPDVKGSEGKLRTGGEVEEGGISRSTAVLLPILAYLVGLVVLLVPFMAFNFLANGTLLPNTFYAKNVEYATLLASPFLLRWLQLFMVPWIGAQILLLPGFVYIAAMLSKRRQWTTLIPIVWTLFLPALYALRLPVAYQHGRYEMPVVPFIVLFGIWGTFMLFEHLRNWVVRQTWVGATVALWLAFWYLGANAYATDVAIIDCEMVETARWVAANAPPEAIVAAHDIGALGYYYNRPVIDLAGLVTPDVIPFMRDQGRLRDYVLSRGATLVVFFPDWYPDLDTDPRLQVVHRQDCRVAREAGGTDMTVYKVR